MGNKNQFQPINDKIVILPNEEAQTTASGLFVPDMAQGHQNKGTVIAVGPGKVLSDGKRAPMQVQEGNQIWYNAVAGFKIVKDDVDYYVVSEDHVFVIEN